MQKQCAFFATHEIKNNFDFLLALFQKKRGSFRYLCVGVKTLIKLYLLVSYIQNRKFSFCGWGTFKDKATNSKWASGGFDYSSAPAPDDSTNGVTSRFPFSFWNDVSQGLPDGAIKHTSTVYQTEDAQYR